MVKCTRCNRSLKKAFIVEGRPYGPVCVHKLFGTAVLASLLNPKKPKSAPKPENDEQLLFVAERPESFQPPDGSKYYTGRVELINTPEEQYCIFAVTPSEVRELSLQASLEHCYHSPTGFNWGYGGSGPAQTAFAILHDYLNGDTQRALNLHQDFKWKVAAHWPMGSTWTLTAKEIETTITLIDVERMKGN